MSNVNSSNGPHRCVTMALHLCGLPPVHANLPWRKRLTSPSEGHSMHAAFHGLLPPLECQPLKTACPKHQQISASGSTERLTPKVISAKLLKFLQETSCSPPRVFTWTLHNLSLHIIITGSLLYIPSSGLSVGSKTYPRGWEHSSRTEPSLVYAIPPFKPQDQKHTQKCVRCTLMSNVYLMPALRRAGGSLWVWTSLGYKGSTRPT